MSGISKEGTNYPATYEDYVPPGAVARALIDIFNLVYPVGSYYETTDTGFDPNVQFGGTWELEAEGLVHISSGTNYEVSDDDQDGGEATHKLTGAEMPSHGHQIRLYNTNGTQGTWKTYDGYGTTVVTNQYGLRNAFGGWTNSTTATVSQSGYGDQAGITTQNGGNGAHNNMQPYKIVNRWHRTA